MNKRIRDKKHLKRVAELGCYLCGGEAVPHHLIASGSHGMGIKAPDCEVLPLCHDHHMGLHAHGDEKAWFANLGYVYEEIITTCHDLYKETLRLRK